MNSGNNTGKRTAPGPINTERCRDKFCDGLLYEGPCVRMGAVDARGGGVVFGTAEFLIFNFSSFATGGFMKGPMERRSSLGCVLLTRRRGGREVYWGVYFF